MLIRHLPDGTIYRLKSNALGGLAVGDGGGFGRATITGKATYQEPTWPEALGNYRFVVYIEDRNEPGVAWTESGCRLATRTACWRLSYR